MTFSRENNGIQKLSRLNPAEKTGAKITLIALFSCLTLAEKICREKNGNHVVYSRENQARKKHIYKYIYLRFAAPVTGGERNTRRMLTPRVSPFPDR